MHSLPVTNVTDSVGAPGRREIDMNHIPRKRFVAWLGGVLACVVLVGAGIAYIAIGISGRNEINHSVAREQIVGTPDMTPAAIREEIAKAGLKNVPDIPTCTVANQPITNGDDAKCFASYMRIHALEASGGLTYAELGRYLDKAGKPTDDATQAAINPATGKPVDNPVRNTWVTETALATGLNVSYFAQQVSLFAIVMGACLLVIGIGLGVLTVFAFGLMPWRTAEVPTAGPPAT
jgi:hypothetical protein